ncbi:MAG: four helix bundle protein [Candidatus Margulisbacteria bacterium]|nr:four helix bundle protein [Candidatus Margulisiibacteriota bacterium]
MSDGSGCAARNVDGKKSKGFIRGYHDLRVYQEAYRAMLLVYQTIIPNIPRYEYDLIDQIRRSCKAVPRLIAEGHSKRHQVKGFQKYIDDAMAESNESGVSLCQVRDLYGKYVNKEECENLVDLYDKISRQLYKLSIAWQKFTKKNKMVAVALLESAVVFRFLAVLPEPSTVSSRATEKRPTINTSISCFNPIILMEPSTKTRAKNIFGFHASFWHVITII